MACANVRALWTRLYTSRSKEALEMSAKPIDGSVIEQLKKYRGIEGKMRLSRRALGGSSNLLNMFLTFSPLLNQLSIGWSKFLLFGVYMSKINIETTIMYMYMDRVYNMLTVWGSGSIVADVLLQ